MKFISTLLLVATALVACAPSKPQVVYQTVEVTRIVESTRVVEATRLVEITTTPSEPKTVVVTATLLPGPLKVDVKLGLFWASTALGQVNIKTTNVSSAEIPGVDYQCTVVGKKTGMTLADETVSTGPISPSQTNISWFQFVPKSENIPGYFEVNCNSPRVEAFSAQFYNPGTYTTLPGRPKDNGTSNCRLALDNYDRAANAYFTIKAKYEKKEATYDEYVGSFLSALGAYYNATAACK